MQIPIRMCDARLAGFADVFGHWPVPMEDISTFAAGLIAFNLSGTRIEVEGEPRTEPVLMGIANDPVFIRYSIGGGDIVSLRVTGGAYDRLFDIDPSAETGIVGMDRDRHPKIAAVYDRLKAADPTPESWFAAMDAALLELLPDAKPPGLVGDMVMLVRGADREWGVAEIAERLGCTIRTLERACKRRYGRTPKRILRAHRLYRTRMLEDTIASRIELEPDFAYADLPHYLNEMRRIYGLNRGQLKDDALFGHDFPYRYLWPDGRAVETEDEMEAWHAEMQRRIAAYPG
ncbi:helix-turn-helix domain-containing protein [Qipengyuania sp. 6B39]|uniref:AraC family transcriptional regulator n=1 Tax=Qipengyuania proteolytica TaxID=2867239 RepID=UPI001C8AD1F9|nr:helix-turn-helix domain-containing protein [Qipengyuania proteolytica]MBX7495700.1 helix-turn-helix domain-containing protein [Qipengyuania proteolytica]